MTSMMLLGAAYSVRSKDKRISWYKLIYQILVIVSPFAFVFGCRYNVGVDHLSYLAVYLGKINRTTEVGFQWLMDTCRENSLPFYIFFAICGFLQIGPIYWGMKKYYKIYPYIGLTLILSCAWLTYCNGIRQGISVSLIFCALQYINKKEFWKYIVAVFIASLFHSSAIICLVFLVFLFINNDIFKNWKLAATLVLTAVLFSNFFNPLISILDVISQHFDMFSDVEGFSKYQDTYLKKIDIDAHLTKRIGYYVNILFSLYIIYLSKISKEYYDSKFINMLYTIYVIGAIFSQLVIGSQILGRINYYLGLWSFVIGALWLYAMKMKRKKIHFYLLIAAYIILFSATLYRAEENTSMFQFFWNITP